MKVGDRVFVRVSGIVEAISHPEPAYQVKLIHDLPSPSGHWQSFERKHWFATAELESTAPITHDWRDVCADMLREGRDKEAVAMLVEKAPHALPYIVALEDVLAAAFAVSRACSDGQIGPHTAARIDDLTDAYNYAIAVRDGDVTFTDDKYSDWGGKH